MITSPIVADCIRCFNSEGAVPNNLHDNVLCPEDYQGISSNSRFLKGQLNCPRVVNRQCAFSIERDRDCRPLAGAKASSLGQAEKYFELDGIVDALLFDVTCGNSSTNGPVGRGTCQQSQWQRDRLQ